VLIERPQQPPPPALHVDIDDAAMSTKPATTNLATDERQPLLPPPPPLTADTTVTGSLGDPEARPAAASVDPPAPPEPEPWTKTSIFWYSVMWTGIIVTAVYIVKGLIESDDVNVCMLCYTLIGTRLTS
jgi:hypothetical protein